MNKLLALALTLAALTACEANCGEAHYTTGGDAAALWDADGDGTADLKERCSANWGSFGSRRYDIGMTELILDPYVPNNDFSEQLSLSDYLLPVATLVFWTSHLTEGNTLDIGQLGGGGLHHLAGTSGDLYSTYPLLRGTLEVLEGPKPGKGTFADEDHTELWRFHWTVEYGDAQNGMVLQTWDAEDWIQIDDGIEIGDPAYFPPDAP